RARDQRHGACGLNGTGSPRTEENRASSPDRKDVLTAAAPDATKPRARPTRLQLPLDAIVVNDCTPIPDGKDIVLASAPAAPSHQIGKSVGPPAPVVVQDYGRT